MWGIIIDPKKSPVYDCQLPSFPTQTFDYSGKPSPRYCLKNFVQDYIKRKKLRRIRAIDVALRTNGAKMTILLRLVPWMPWNILNFVVGMTGMKFYAFAVGSVGMIPWIMVCSFIGHGLGSLDEVGKGTASASSKTSLIILIVGLVTTIIVSAVVSAHANKALKNIEEEGGGIFFSPTKDSSKQASNMQTNSSRESSRESIRSPLIEDA